MGEGGGEGKGWDVFSGYGTSWAASTSASTFATELKGVGLNRLRRRGCNGGASAASLP